LISIGLAFVRLTIFAGNVLANDQLQVKEGHERRPKQWRSPMPTSLNSSSLAKAFFSLMLLLLVPAATQRVFAQDGERTFGDSFIPLVYHAENTGAQYPAPNFPSFAQLPIIRPLPDPFQFSGGWRDASFLNWERRRNEIKAAIEKYELGPKPDCSDCTITSSYTPPAAGSSTGSLTVVVTRNGKSLTLTSGIYIPQGMGSGPFPALIPMELGGFTFNGTTFNFPPPTPPDYGSLPPTVFQGLPIATVGFVLTQVAGYAFSSPSVHTADPFYTLYPELCAGTCSGTSNSGEYAAWSWGVSRLIDGMEIATHQSVNPLPIDMSHLAVTGCSYAGKMALFAGAFDERIALSIAQENGGGGAPSWRVSHEIESNFSVEDIDDTNYDWFAGQMMQFAGDNVYKLPEDHHELMAMMAPRALLETGNTSFYWLSNGSNYVSARATQQIYNAMGIGDRFGFYIDGAHAHCATLPAEAPAIASFVNKFMLGQANTNTDVEVYPNGPGQPATLPSGNGAGNSTTPNYPYYFPTMDYRRWSDWWGSNNPQFPNNWNTGGTVNLMMNNFLFVHPGDTVMAGYALSLGGNHPAATVTAANANIQTDISCPDGSSYTLTIPFTQNQPYSITAGDNSWLPSNNPFSSLVYQGSATATPPTGSPACYGGHTTHAYFKAVGIQDGSAGDPAGPGLVSTDTTDPLRVQFHCSDNGFGGQWSPTVTVNPNPPN
jgi:hypothetical protein